MMKKTPSFPSYESLSSWKRVFRAMPHHAQPPSNPPVSEEWNRIGNTDIHLDRWDTPYASARAILIHGAGLYGRLLGPFAWHLSLQGIETVVPDLPGYGLTQTPNINRLSYDDWREALISLVDSETATSDLPLFLVGFSTGGMLAYDVAALSGRVSGVVSTGLIDPSQINFTASKNRWPLFSKLFPSFFKTETAQSDSSRMAQALTGQVNGITSSIAICEEVEDDELVGGLSMPRPFIESWKASPPVVPPESFTSCPVLLAYPAADQWSSFEASKAFYDRLNVTKRVVVLENGGHWPIESKAFYQFDTAVSNFILTLASGKPLEPHLL